MAHEVGLGLLWLIATLEGDSTLAGYAPGGVHRGMAPVGTATPFIVVNYQTGHDVTTANKVRIMSNVTYQVKASGPVSQTADIVSAAGRIDELLDNDETRNIPVTGGLILDSSRDEPVAYDEEEGAGEQQTNFGGLYSLEIRSN
jgi:hypothetical protein